MSRVEWEILSLVVLCTLAVWCYFKIETAA